MRRVFAVAALTFGGACGGTPASPSATPPNPSILPSGAYTLTLSDSIVYTCQNGICTSVVLCTGPSPAQPPSPQTSFAVTVQRDGDGATIAPVTPGDSLRLTLQVSGSSLSGSIFGTATAPNGATVTASGTVVGVVSSLPSLPNVPQGTNAAGTFDGALSVAGTSCGTPTHNWGLLPR
jgi:hypothetical protein